LAIPPSFHPGSPFPFQAKAVDHGIYTNRACISAFIQAKIRLLPDYFRNLLSTLLTVPDNLVRFFTMEELPVHTSMNKRFSQYFKTSTDKLYSIMKKLTILFWSMHAFFLFPGRFFA